MMSCYFAGSTLILQNEYNEILVLFHSHIVRGRLDFLPNGPLVPWHPMCCTTKEENP